MHIYGSYFNTYFMVQLQLISIPSNFETNENAG